MSWLRLTVFATACFLQEAAALGATQSAIPAGVILVKGARSSATGSSNALPEEGVISQDKYKNPYFGVSYMFGDGWTQRYEGPPPSEGGYYVLAQMESLDPAGAVRSGHFIIAAQDLFFTETSARNVAEFIDHYRSRLGEDYRVERSDTMRMTGHEFVRLDYLSPVSGLHWRVLATEIRCHVLEFVFTGSDSRSLDRQIAHLGELIERTDSVPVCIKDFANDDTVLEREEPIFSEPRFNQVPVRIVIDREGKVKHVHFLSAFPAQARAVTEALAQWRFKPYSINGQPVEVETGVVFGRTSRSASSTR
jgi:Gram-negative bacterial TonB protein C-terminal